MFCSRVWMCQYKYNSKIWIQPKLAITITWRSQLWYFSILLSNRLLSFYMNKIKCATFLWKNTPLFRFCYRQKRVFWDWGKGDLHVHPLNVTARAESLIAQISVRLYIKVHFGIYFFSMVGKCEINFKRKTK